MTSPDDVAAAVKGKGSSPVRLVRGVGAKVYEQLPGGKETPVREAVQVLRAAADGQRPSPKLNLIERFLEEVCHAHGNLFACMRIVHVRVHCGACACACALCAVRVRVCTTMRMCMHPGGRPARGSADGAAGQQRAAAAAARGAAAGAGRRAAAALVELQDDEHDRPARLGVGGQ